MSRYLRPDFRMARFATFHYLPSFAIPSRLLWFASRNRSWASIPDILPGLAELLLEASERCQLVVTTHSEVLVDALTAQPECVVVCEKEDGQTKLKRLSRTKLKHWLDDYRLGDLWSSGQIGGNRW